MGLSRRSAAVLLIALALAGCGRGHRPGKPESYVADAYLTPPSLGEAVREPSGALRLSGQAPVDSLVRLRAPDAGEATARADAAGHWALDLPPAERPRLYAFQAEVAGRVIRGEGALAVMPAPAPAAMLLRAGFAAVPANRGVAGRLQLITLDFDGGGAAASGLAPPDAQVRLSVDGGVVGLAKADNAGRFGILAIDPRHPVGAGRHHVQVETRDGLSIEREAEIIAPDLATDQVVATGRTAAGWTVSWRLPGGGEQTSLVFDDAVALGRPRPPPVAPAPTGAR